jgi:hypothetical protein
MVPLWLLSVDRRALENVLATDATKQAMTAFDSEPGLPDFSLYTKRGKMSQMSTKMYQMVIKYPLIR